MTWIKICGITNIEDGLKAASLGVDALGFIFAPSPRRVDPLIAREIIRRLPSSILKVGVFVDEIPARVEEIAAFCHLSDLQLHGEESPEYCQKFSIRVIKALRIKDAESIEEMTRFLGVSILLDTHSPAQMGGTGNPFPWEIALKAKEKGKFILAGGLNPLNVGEAIQEVRPWGVDVSSGVEIVPGKKDPQRMIDFVKEVKRADEMA
jgi:phosphoribosylanthranilate isomerase